MSKRHRILGRTGISVFEVGFGAWAIGGNRSGWGYGPTDDRTSIRALETAVGLGCNFFDTADWYGYGHSEELLGKALGAHRHSIIIATKAGFDFYHGLARHNFDPAYLRFALHQSLRRLRTSYIDIYQLHNPPTEVILSSPIVMTLQDLRKQGKVRYFGVSVGSVDDAVIAAQSCWPDTIQAPYNLLAPEAEWKVFQLASAAGIGIIAREPLANGFLTGKYGATSQFPEGDFRRSAHFDPLRFDIEKIKRWLQPYCHPGETLAQLALRFALEPTAVSVVVCGCKNPSQVIENFAAQTTTIR